jgi:phage shock protein B
MGEHVLVPAVAIVAIFIGLPWMILHYMTKWRSGRGISVEDERLLDELHETARLLDSRLDSIERIITADHPNWKEDRIASLRPERLTGEATDFPIDRRVRR